MLKGLKSEIRLYCQAEVDQDLNKGSVKYKFIGVYKKLPQSEREELLRCMALDDDDKEKLTEVDVLRKVLIRWEGIKVDDGKDFDYSEKNLNELLEASEYRMALLEQMHVAITNKDFVSRRQRIQQSLEKNL